MTREQVAYLESRAEQEIEAARQSTDPRVVRAHYLLAGYYLDLIHNPDAMPPGAHETEGGLEPAFA
jgi:hypothetical protein